MKYLKHGFARFNGISLDYKPVTLLNLLLQRRFFCREPGLIARTCLSPCFGIPFGLVILVDRRGYVVEPMQDLYCVLFDQLDPLLRNIRPVKLVHQQRREPHLP